MSGRFNRNAIIAIVCAAAGSMAAHAQSAPTIVAPERVSEVTVTPVVADAGVARTIKISGKWPSCAPVGATVTSAAAFQSGTRVVRLILPQTFLPCPAPYIPYSVTASYTPAARGIEKLLVLNADGEYLGEGLVDTRAPNDDRSAFNITGMWYDPQSNGSGLTFVHSLVNDNAVFGTWYLYDTSGKPTWYTIQNAVWTTQGRVMEGALYESRQGTAAAICPPPFTACPPNYVPRILVFSTFGRVRLTLTGAGAAHVEALSFSGTVMFASDIIRADI